MTISKEERAEWHKRLNAPYSDPCREAREMRDFSLRLLDALESAEARAEAAERERDVLASLMASRDLCMTRQGLGMCTKKAKAQNRDVCIPCWLEWARRQASEEA